MLRRGSLHLLVAAMAVIHFASTSEAWFSKISKQLRLLLDACSIYLFIFYCRARLLLGIITPFPILPKHVIEKFEAEVRN